MDSTDTEGTPTPGERRKLTARTLAGMYFQVKTPVVAACAETFFEAVEVAEHGAMLFGGSRLGKTMASRWMLNQASSYLESSFPWLEVPVRKMGGTDREAFFSHLLSITKHRHQGGKLADKRNRLTRWFCTRARRSGSASFTLFFDEAHVLPPAAFRWLLEIDNELDGSGTRLIALLVGQNELLTLRDRIAEAENGHQFIERFMAVEIPFRGLSSVEELRQCLHNFAHTEYPAKSGMTFAQQYIPQLVAEGFELDSIAPSMWAGMDATWRTRFKSETELPMAHATRCLVMLLNDLADRDDSEAGVPPSPEDIAEAVRRSHFSGYVERRFRYDLQAARRVARASAGAV